MCNLRRTTIYLSLLSMLLLVVTTGGVFAVWMYAGATPATEQQDISVHLGAFVFTPEEMPGGEISLIQRLSDILNQKYTTDIVTDSLDYLINETIQVYWGGNIYIPSCAFRPWGGRQQRCSRIPQQAQIRRSRCRSLFRRGRL